MITALLLGAVLARAPVDARIFPGISIAIGNAHGIKHVEAHGYANIAHQIPVTPDTPFRVASVSKSMTAVAVLMLAQQGKVSLDKPISTYVPRYALHGGEMTVRQVLSMSAGIPGKNHGDPILKTDDPISEEQFFDELNKLPLFAAPGKEFDYSNVGYYLLAQLVQNVSGQRYDAFMKQHIFIPAGMTHTYSDVGAANAALATGYVHRLPADPFLACRAADWSGEIGAGTIISTPSDLIRFDMALMNGMFINAARRAELFKPEIAVSPNTSYALGWFVTKNGMIQHGGDFSVAYALNVIYPDGTFVALAANSSDLGGTFDRTYFANQMQNAYGSKPFPLGEQHTASLLDRIPKFSTCAELDKVMSGL